MIFTKDAERRMKAMHVMMLAMDYPPAVFAGIGVHAHGLAKALSALGADVDVFVVPHAETIASAKYRVEVDGRITVYRFEFDHEDTEAYRSRNLPTRRELRNIIWNVSTANVLKPILDIALAKDYDVIHTHDYFNVIVAEAVRAAKGIPIVNTAHAHGTGGLKLHYHLRHYACLTADANIAVSRHLAEELSAEPDLAARGFEVIGNGVSRSEGEKPENASDIAFVGRLVESKGCGALLRAFALLAARGGLPSDCRLFMVGDGPEREKLQRFAREEKLESRVVFTGHVSNAEARAVMRRARLLAAPSRHEAFGLVALEAMAEGTCVIASNTAGFTDFMKDGENGLLVAPDSAEELRGAILKLFKDDALRRTLEKKGFETASRYDWKEIARRTMAVYERCTAKK